jgi:hypothetical protein
MTHGGHKIRIQTNETTVGIQIPVLLAIRHKSVTLSRKIGTRGDAVI